MKKSLLKQSLNIALNELDKHPQYDCFPHWTFLVKDNQIIGKGYNRRHEPPKYLGYHRKEDKTFRPKWHSEIDAIHNTSRFLEDFEVINIRLNKLGESRIAMPCTSCMNILLANKVKRVYFTTDTKWGQI